MGRATTGDVLQRAHQEVGQADSCFAVVGDQSRPSAWRADRRKRILEGEKCVCAQVKAPPSLQKPEGQRRTSFFNVVQLCKTAQFQGWKQRSGPRGKQQRSQQWRRVR